MAIPVWVPGQILTSSDVNGWLAPSGVVKPSDQSRTSNTTLGNDTDLVVSVLANAKYVFECYLDYEGGTINVSDLKWQWTVPAAATMRYQAFYISTANAIAGGSTQLGSDIITAGTKGAGVLMAVMMRGSVVVSSTAGNMQLTWAQNTSSATATIVHAQSYLQLVRMF